MIFLRCFVLIKIKSIMYSSVMFLSNNIIIITNNILKYFVLIKIKLRVNNLVNMIMIEHPRLGMIWLEVWHILAPTWSHVMGSCYLLAWRWIHAHVMGMIHLHVMLEITPKLVGVMEHGCPNMGRCMWGLSDKKSWLDVVQSLLD